ncbi:hypothetical protein [Chondromyces crocatus]|uniref:Uncharacterized protein n=1 Tax=Chondromyces crocatus TaxID=52 RepID=A0A0K1EMY2_CHOCO|nr:hypothetical protein [Chondromyces crocatus]AKT42186.1 uncharacterized protein CMC5_064090 [Chondromyces crocatus]
MAAEFLRDFLDIPVPSFSEARIVPADLTEALPVARHADLVVLLLAGRPVFAIVIEAQLGRDPNKKYTWPSYLTAVRARHQCLVCLLVVTTDPTIARWSARPIRVGVPGWTLTPFVIGPEAIPVITKRQDARGNPEIAVLSAMAHGRSPEGLSIGLAAIGAIAKVPPERQRLYIDVVLSSLNQAARRSLEAKMKNGYVYQSNFARSYVAQGRREGLLEGERNGLVTGKAQAVLAVLEARAIKIPATVRKRVLASTDLTELDQWVRRAAAIGDASALFTTSPS